ncbi:MAG TPA: glycosyltransferase family 9 protein, partial [Chthonomonadaceae bacterium]|nr:glycosyltransferase family 9 protein [Chthonomonadaceae bacterium]
MNWLGDAVMTLPALASLRAALPDAHITILSSRKFAGLYSALLVDETIELGRETSLAQVVARIRAGRFAAAVVFPNSLRSALEPWLAGIPKRVGLDHRGRGLLFTKALSPRGLVDMRRRSTEEINQLAADPYGSRAPLATEGHHLNRYLRIVELLGADPSLRAPRLEVDPAEIADARRRLVGDALPPSGPLIGMCSGAEYGAAKRWPEERFIDAACTLHKRSGCRWLLFGTQSERSDCERIAAGIRTADVPVLNLAGRTSLRELAALLAGCDAAMGND